MVHTVEMKYSKAEIKAEAARLGVDLGLPYARAYARACLRSKEKQPYQEREPADASGYTADFGVLVIRE